MRRGVCPKCNNSRMKINNELNARLDALQGEPHASVPATLLQMAKAYSVVERAIAVLSDLRRGESHIYYGGVGSELGMADEGDYSYVDKIWEEEILSRLHPDDLEAKQLMELQFLYFQQQQRSLDWRMESLVRMHDAEGRYHRMLHRIVYLSDGAARGIDYALCLYSFSLDDYSGGRMVNMRTGEVRSLADQDYSAILSLREREVLGLIRDGRLSKEIADALCISVNTVNRHRQNILRKLQCANSIEACRRAAELGL